jgi:ribosomal protein S18 acetylase RimI-like enzyme
MPLVLRLMTSAEFDPWREAFIQEWGDDLAQADDLPREAAVLRAEQDLDAQLLDGVATRGHFLFVLLDGARRVGTLWYSVDGEGQAFLDDVTIVPAERRKGYGRQALALLEADAKARGCDRVVLNVYGHNPGAQALYEAAGYATKRREMAKTL